MLNFYGAILHQSFEFSITIMYDSTQSQKRDKGSHVSLPNGARLRLFNKKETKVPSQQMAYSFALRLPFLCNFPWLYSACELSFSWQLLLFLKDHFGRHPWLVGRLLGRMIKEMRNFDYHLYPLKIYIPTLCKHWFFGNTNRKAQTTNTVRDLTMDGPFASIRRQHETDENGRKQTKEHEASKDVLALFLRPTQIPCEYFVHLRERDKRAKE